MANEQERLQKVIAQSGITSRRKAERLITDGLVRVNDKLVTELGTKVSPTDKVEVDGVPLEKEAPVYYLLYKPRGVISSMKDDKGRKVVTDYLTDIPERAFPIGRLDFDSSGIILLTNDGEFANLLMHPKYEVDKVYVAKLDGIPKPEELKKLKKGIKSDNELLKAVRYNVLSTDRQNKSMIIELTLREGKNRHIRRMMKEMGYSVKKLKREKYGMLTLKGLQPGEYRSLTPKEVKQIRSIALKNC